MPSGGAGHASRRVATDFGTCESPQGSYAHTLIRTRPTESRARRPISARRALAMRRRGSLLLARLAIAGGHTLAQAQEPSDLTELTFEELMKIDVVSINVLATHVPFAGQWMVAYEYMLEAMDGNRDGTRRLSHAQILQQFDTVPTNMSVETHMRRSCTRRPTT
jgi:hypothetical protein